MATSYTGLRVQDTYNAIIKIGDNSNLTSTPKLLSDGLGNDSPLYLSGTRLGIGISPAYQFHTSGNAKIGGNLIVSGNLTVNGTLTYLNVQDLAVEDPIIKLAKDNTANTLDIGLFGKYVATGTKYKGFFNDASDDKFKLFIGTTVEPTTTVDTSASGYTVGTLVANLEGNVTGTVSSLSNHTTTNLAEGTNLYYTNARADARVNLQTGANLDLSSKDTDDLAEGTTNLYYTNARFDTRFTSKDTDDLSEGTTNLYFTTARARASFTAGTGVTITNGEIAIGQDVSTTSNVTFGNITGSAISGTTGTFSDAITTNLSAEGTYFTGGSGAVRQLSITSGTNISAHALHTFNIASSNGKYEFDIEGTTEFSLDSSSATFAGSITGTTANFSGQVTIPETPTADAHAASKKYVDDNTGSADVAKRLEVTVKNVSGGSLAKGTVVHAAPTATPPSGNVIEVIAADANDATKMPSIGVLNETIADEAEGEAVMFGAVSGIDTSSFNIGDELYVSTTAGELTATKPTANDELVQKVAIVIKSHASNGLIKVFGAGRANDVPNQIDRDVNFTDNSKLTFGDSTTPDFRIYHEGTDSIIQNYTGSIYIDNNADNQDIVFRSDNGSGGIIEYFRIDGSTNTVPFGRSPHIVDNVKLYFGNDTANDASIKWDSTASQLFIDGVSKFLSNVYFTGNAYFGDNDKLYFGDLTTPDLQIYHNGSHSYIDNGATDFYLRTTGNGIFFKNIAGGGNEHYAKFISNGAVELYYDAVKKFETTSAGVSVTGNVYATSFVGNAAIVNQVTAATSGGDIKFKNNAGTDRVIIRDSGIVDVNGGQLNVTSSGGYGRIELGGASGGYIDLKAPASDDYDMRFITGQGGNEITTNSGDLKINTSNTLALTIDSSQNATFAGTITATGGSTNNNDDANILTLNASEHARLLVDTSSTSGHRATLALESNGNELLLTTTGSASELTSVGALTVTASATTFTGDVTANSFIKSGGTSSQYLMADGSVSTGTGGVTGTGVNNRLAIWNGTTAIDSDSDFYVDGDTIFTTNFQASGNISITGTSFLDGDVTIGDTNSAFIGMARAGANYLAATNASGYLVFRTAGSNERMRIDAGGDVLMGNTVVNPASGFASQRGFGYDNSTGNLEVASTSGTAMTIGRNESDDGEILELRKESNIKHSFGSTTSYILSNLGINTTSPDSKLDVTGGDITVNTTGTGFMNFKYSGSQKGTIGTDGIDLKITANADLQLLPQGNVGIGTVSPGSKLQVYSTATRDIFISGHGTQAQNTWQGEHAFFISAGQGVIIGKANAGNDTNRLHILYNTSNGDANYLGYNTSNIAKYKLSTNGNSYFNGGSVGINTTSPEEKLHIIGSALISNNEFYKVENTTGTNYKIAGLTNGNVIQIGAIDYTTAGTIFAGGDNISITTGGASGTSRIKIDSSGNVGIGTTSPSSLLHIQGSTYNRVQTYFDGDYTSGFKFSDLNGGIWYDAGADDLYLNANHANSQVILQSGGSTTLTLDASGDATFAQKINAGGRILTEATTSNALLQVKYNSSNYLEAYYYGINVVGGNFEFKTGGTTRMVIDANSGSVGIGTTSPGSKLEVITSGANSVVELDNSNTNYTLIQYNASGATKGFSGFNAGFMLFGGEAGTTTRLQSGGSYAATILENGDFGIGTTSPSVKLDVRLSGTTGKVAEFHNSVGYGIGFTVESDGGVNTINSESNQALAFATNGASNERMRIDSSGRVGIGTASPSAKLDVESTSTSSSPVIEITNTSSITYNHSINAFAPNLTNNENNIFIIGKSGNTKNSGYIGYKWKADADNSNVLTFGHWASNNLMNLTGDGKLGIGTETPENKLHILTSTTDTSSQLMVQNGSTGDAAIKFNISGQSYVIGIDNSDSNKFKISGSSNLGTTDRLVVDGSGNVGIGLTNPSYQLHVGGSAEIDGTLYTDRVAAGIPMPSHIVDAYSSTSGVFAGRFVYAGTSGSDCAMLLRLAGGSTAPSYVDFIYGSVQTGYITTNGSATFYGSASDYRLKENVVELNGALDRLDNLQPKRFNFTSTPEQTVDGFLAHEVADVVPEAIHGVKDAVNQDGEIIAQGIDQAKLVPLLVAAVQELRAEVELLKSQINS